MSNRLRAELADAFTALRRGGFPESTKDEAGAEVHALLAEFDGHVAGLALTVAGGGMVDKSLLKSDPALSERIDKLGGSATPASLIARYRTRFDTLDRMLGIMRQIG